MSLLDIVDELAERIQQSGTADAKHLLAVLTVVQQEVMARLRFEEALLKYVTNSPSNPYAASTEFIAFLKEDTAP